MRAVAANGPCFMSRISVASTRPLMIGMIVKKTISTSALTIGASSVGSVKISA
ncbi:hypothetical protein [Pseudolysinimonas kribbensis]|uniref:hypothetical protein n=1 Tax=Pseudolysinimonas kribbensis TaxID=433641 RepID=UPI0024E13DEE|nr:hypothetical protein [Pseudolysinimonas kribbensis]